jgi:Xaa-Pro aminopeptidase
MGAPESRAAFVQQFIKSKKINGFLVTNIKNIRYLTGFTGSSGLVLITGNIRLFFTDFRYKEQAASEVSGFEVELEKGKRMDTLRRFMKKLAIRSLCFEKSASYEFYENLKKLHVRLMPQKDFIENMRKIKDTEEIECIKKAVQRAERAFTKIKPKIRVGIKEKEIALWLEWQLKKEGCRRVPFDIIVASGKNASMPHASPTEKRIQKGDFVIIDWGGEADGYYSDMTRTLLLKDKAISGKIKIYDAVNKARQKAIASVREGINTQDIDRIARDTIRNAGYGEFFGHGTGHGVGLDVHEPPGISWVKSEVVYSGMVFTIEPGIYIPELGGVRIEDMVLVKNRKAELLTSLSRELEIIK